jgi:TonB family protein
VPSAGQSHERTPLHSRIEPDGRVSNATVSGSPNATLAALVLQAIMQWKFEQPLVGGKPTRISVAHQFVFRLEENK